MAQIEYFFRYLTPHTDMGSIWQKKHYKHFFIIFLFIILTKD